VRTHRAPRHGSTSCNICHVELWEPTFTPPDLQHLVRADVPLPRGPRKIILAEVRVVEGRRVILSDQLLQAMSE
jgi:hypothetical protein